MDSTSALHNRIQPRATMTVTRSQRRMLLRSLPGVATLLFTAWGAAPAPLAAQNTLVPEGLVHYAASPVPDRIVLTFAGDPATSLAVSWRTDPSLTQAVAEISVAYDTPGLHLTARQVAARTFPLERENGPAHHHQVVFTGLEPNTLYAYRVQGGGTWSEWFQVRTASAGAEPFSFLYFGDAQNAVKSHWSRTVRQAFSDLPTARFMLHAGDLVNQGSTGVWDDEWGEWFDAGGWLNGMLPSIAAPGNHEYVVLEPGTRRVLSPAWNAHFSMPSHGPAGLEGTVYHVDYQGVRFISLNSYEALENEGSAALQARWLEPLLRDNPHPWTIVTYHHPMFSVSQGRDNPLLREHWKPLFDRYGVDLALQGHDHTYGRQHENVTEGTQAYEGDAGTMYVVSVSGPKMYYVSDAAEQSMTRLAEDTQLYQLIHLNGDTLRFESRTVTGELYDAFDLVKGADGRNRLVDRSEGLMPERRCGRPEIPGYREDRCWEGTDFIRPPEPR
jgi:acid phosphatase type 7